MNCSQKITNFREERKKEISQLWRSSAAISDLIIENESEFRKLKQITKKKATPIPHQNDGKSNISLMSAQISPIRKTKNYENEEDFYLSDPGDSESDSDNACFKDRLSDMLNAELNSSIIISKEYNDTVYNHSNPLVKPKQSEMHNWLNEILDKSFEEESFTNDTYKEPATLSPIKQKPQIRSII